MFLSSGRASKSNFDKPKMLIYKHSSITKLNK